MSAFELGGGSLPDWWTVDSTEDEESVIFNGAVTIDPVGPGAFPLLIQGADGQSAAMLAIDDFDGNTLCEVSSTGLVESVSGFRVEMDGEPDVGELGGGTLTLANSDDQTVLDLSDAPSLSLSVGGNAVFEVDDTGAVTISPSDDAVLALDMQVLNPPEDFSSLLRVQGPGAELGGVILLVDSSGTVLFQSQDVGATPVKITAAAGQTAPLLDVEGGIQAGGQLVGFFGTTPAAQPAEPTTINEVVAALQTLGLVAT